MRLTVEIMFKDNILIDTQIKFSNITAHLSIHTEKQVCLYLPAARKIIPKDSDCNTMIRF